MQHSTEWTDRIYYWNVALGQSALPDLRKRRGASFPVARGAGLGDDDGQQNGLPMLHLQSPLLRAGTEGARRDGGMKVARARRERLQ